MSAQTKILKKGVVMINFLIPFFVITVAFANGISAIEFESRKLMDGLESGKKGSGARWFLGTKGSRKDLAGEVLFNTGETFTVKISDKNDLKKNHLASCISPIEPGLKRVKHGRKLVISGVVADRKDFGGGSLELLLSECRFKEYLN